MFQVVKVLLNIYAPDSLGYCSKMCVLCSEELRIDVACGKKIQSLEKNLDRE